jgi:uncharacterized iron-regulated protein
VRRFLALGTSLLLAAACTGPPRVPDPDLRISTGQGAPLSAALAVAALREADFVLLGEVHDNPVHHRERAALLRALADLQPTVVFEQFARSSDAALAAPPGTDLDAWVDRAGFDRRGWGWPLHRPLIEAALASGLRLRGGNLERDQARQIARQGAAAVPADLATFLAQPLPAAALEVMNQGLLDGHCGQLPAAALPRMRDAQVARDVAMADAMIRSAAEAGGRAVLIAGNGHVRRDHGVPLWLARMRPSAKVVSVGFLEADDADGSLPPAAERALYGITWVTPRRQRPDPCAGFSMAPKASQATP